MTRPLVVQATFQLPYRAGGGGAARQFFLLRELARDFDVAVIAADDAGASAEAREQLAQFATTIVVPPPTWSRSPLRRALRLGEMIASRRPYASLAMDPLKAPLRAAINGLPRAPDVLYVEPSTIADWRMLAPSGCATVLGFHDLTFAAYRERARRTSDRRSRALLELEWRRMRRLELHQATAADLNVMISALEQRDLWRLAPQARTVLVRNGVDLDYFRRPAGSAPRPDGPLVLVGSLNHPPNIDAAQRMARDVLPLLRSGGRDLRLQLVGRRPAPEVTALGALPGVDVVGEVADVRPYLAAAAVVCAPIMFGGGVRVKLLDAMAMGCAIVSTPKAAEGLALRDGEQLVIAPIEQFSAALGALLDDPARTARLAAAGRAFVEREHGWATSGRALRQAVASVLPRR